MDNCVMRSGCGVLSNGVVGFDGVAADNNAVAVVVNAIVVADIAMTNTAPGHTSYPTWKKKKHVKCEVP